MKQTALALAPTAESESEGEHGNAGGQDELLELVEHEETQPQLGAGEPFAPTRASIGRSLRLLLVGPAGTLIATVGPPAAGSATPVDAAGAAARLFDAHPSAGGSLATERMGGV